MRVKWARLPVCAALGMTVFPAKTPVSLILPRSRTRGGECWRQSLARRVTSVGHTSRARADLLDIWSGIAIDNLDAADRVLDRLEARVRILRLWPKSGVACPKIAHDARMLVEHPYVILYRLVVGAVQIIRVLHGARHIDDASFMAGVE